MVMQNNPGQEDGRNGLFSDSLTEFSPDAMSRLVGAVLDLDDTEAAWPDGPRLGQYTLIEQLGEGGSGIAYLARRSGSQQLVTIKVFKKIGDRRVVWRELEALTQIQCAAAPRLYEVDEHAGHLYIVYEFVDGLPLPEYARQYCASLRDHVRLLANVARSMQTMHEQGLIHRDIKPGNIIITNDERILFVDFGTAVVLRTRQLNQWTVDGELLGTPGYMSPEQARGEHSQLTTRSDVYGLGAMAYRLLTERLPHPHDGTNSELVHRVMHDPPRDPRALDPRLPKPLAAVMHKAVARHPNHRFATALEFAQELERWLAGRPIETVPIPWWERTWLAAKRRPAVATVSGIAAAAILAAVVFAGAAVSGENEAQKQKAISENAQAIMVRAMRSFVTAKNTGEFERAFELLSLLEHQVEASKAQNSVIADAIENDVVTSRQDFAIEILGELYGEDVISDPELRDSMIHILNQLERSESQPESSERR